MAREKGLPRGTEPEGATKPEEVTKHVHGPRFVSLTHEDCTCEACLRGPMTVVPHRDFLAQYAEPYEVIISDVEGPMSVSGHEGSRYFVTLLVSCTKASEVVLIKDKSEIPRAIRESIQRCRESNRASKI